MTMTSSGQFPKPPSNVSAATAAPQIDPAVEAAQQAAQVSTPETAIPDAIDIPQISQRNPRPDPWGGIQAKPLMAPAFDQIKKKNPNIELRWVNRSVQGAATPHLRYEQMCAMGWVPVTATKDPKTGEITSPDVHLPPGTYKDGHIQIYDVILMKIDRVKYIGALRFNHERVNNAVRRHGVKAGADENLRNDFAKEGVLKHARGKVGTFFPGEKDFK